MNAWAVFKSWVSNFITWRPTIKEDWVHIVHDELCMICSNIIAYDIHAKYTWHKACRGFKLGKYDGETRAQVLVNLNSKVQRIKSWLANLNQWILRDCVIDYPKGGGIFGSKYTFNGICL